MKKSALQRVRAEYQPKLPKALQGPVKLNIGEATESVADQEEIKKLFPHTYGLPIVQFETAEAAERVEEPFNVGIILSGGQAPGGHNVVSGIFDGIKSLNKECRLYGFLMGPSGFINHQYMELTAGYIKDFRNTGGFDIIGSGRTKLETPEQFESGLKILKELNIKALVIIGGDDSNTNAAVLAEYYKNINAGVQVIGVPSIRQTGFDKLRSYRQNPYFSVRRNRIRAALKAVPTHAPRPYLMRSAWYRTAKSGCHGKMITAFPHFQLLRMLPCRQTYTVLFQSSSKPVQ